LNIDSTDINSGLEYLPDSLEKISCDGKLSIPFKNYVSNGRELWYDYSVWRKDNLDLIKQIRKNEKLMTIFALIETALAKGKSANEPLSQVEKMFSALILYLEEEVRLDKEILYQERKLEANVEISQTNF
jgi:hypothetical protein